jgi:hypothetical protein
VKLEVNLDGRTRTFNLQNLNAGHAMTVDIEPALEPNGEPNEASLTAELREALGTAIE